MDPIYGRSGSAARATLEAVEALLAVLSIKRKPRGYRAIRPTTDFVDFPCEGSFYRDYLCTIMLPHHVVVVKGSGIFVAWRE